MSLNPAINAQDGQVPAISDLHHLVELEQGVRSRNTTETFGFFVVNESKVYLDYEYALFFQKTIKGTLDITHISGIAKVDRNIPVVQSAEALIRLQNKKELKDILQIIDKEGADKEFLEKWHDVLPPHMLFVPFYLNETQLGGGMLLFSKTTWPQDKLRNIGHLMDAYRYSWTHLKTRKRINPNLAHVAERKRSTSLATAIAVVGICLAPIRLSVLAPAEVVALEPSVVTSPQEGVVEKIVVPPNHTVKPGDVLFSLDKTDVKNAHELSLRQLEVAKAKLARAIQLGFEDTANRAEVRVLRTEIEEKALESDYTQGLLDRADVKAKEPGIAVYSNSDEWEGKPVVTGEKVMMIAQKGKVQLEAWLPVAESLNLPDQAKAKLFLNSDPINPIDAKISYTSFDAQVTPDQILAYRVLASFETDRPMLGEQGTAKIYGYQVPFFYYIFRRPLAWLRQTVGI